MSAVSVGWAYTHSPMTGAAFAVHLAIADSANDQHDFEFWMAQANLAQKARVSRATANRAIAALIEAGLLTVLEDNSKAGKPCRYRFEMPRGVCHGDTGGVTQSYTGVSRGATQTQETTQENTNASADHLFEAFWEMYPRKTAKGFARTAFSRALKKVSLEELMSATAKYAKANTKTERRYIAHPATWLNAERWLDNYDLFTHTHDDFPEDI